MLMNGRYRNLRSIPEGSTLKPVYIIVHTERWPYSNRDMRVTGEVAWGPKQPYLGKPEMHSGSFAVEDDTLESFSSLRT